LVRHTSGSECFSQTACLRKLGNPNHLRGGLAVLCQSCSCPFQRVSVCPFRRVSASCTAYMHRAFRRRAQNTLDSTNHRAVCLYVHPHLAGVEAQYVGCETRPAGHDPHSHDSVQLPGQSYCRFARPVSLRGAPCDHCWQAHHTHPSVLCRTDDTSDFCRIADHSSLGSTSHPTFCQHGKPGAYWVRVYLASPFHTCDMQNSAQRPCLHIAGMSNHQASLPSYGGCGISSRSCPQQVMSLGCYLSAIL